MKSRHASVITLLVFLLTMSGAILFAQQPPNAHERSVKSQDDSIDVVVRHGNPATRLVETIENSVRIIKNEPIVTESLDDAKVPAELGEETKQPEQTPVQMMHSVHVEWYSYRSAAAVRSPRAWSVHHNRATAYHPQSFTYHPTRFRGYTPKRDWTYHPKRDWTYHPKRDWTYHPKRD